MNWKKKLATCTALIVLSTTIIHIINRLTYFLSTIDNLLGKREGQYYEWRFGNIFYQKQGKGEPILLIHDLTACSSEYEWNALIDNLSKTNTVYSLDLLGCGKSDKPNFIYTNFLYVQLVTDFIKHVIGKSTDIIVTGTSSSFVLMACKNDNTIINKIIMINPVSISLLAKNPSKRTKLLKLLINIPVIGTLLYNILYSKNSIEQTFESDYFYNPQLVNSEMIQAYCEAAHTANTHSKYLFASIKGRYTNVNITECLKQIDNSIFIIIGSGNPNYKNIAEEYQNYTPAIEIQEIQKAKYLPQLEVPDELAEQIRILFEI